MPTTLIVQLAMCDKPDSMKPVELSLPLTHLNLLEAVRKKYKAATRQSRLFDGVSGAEIEEGCTDVELASSKVVVSGKTGWKGADRLRAAREAGSGSPSASDESVPVSVAAVESEPVGSGRTTSVAAWASPRAEERATVPPVQVQFVSFSYDRGQPRDTSS